MRLFLDANVLFSASNAGTNLARLIELALDKATALTSDLAYEEARRNIILKRPSWQPRFEELASQVKPVPSVRFALSVQLADADAPLLCAAIRARCTQFATGDRRDFGHLFDRSVEGVTIISMLRLAELLSDDAVSGVI